MFLVFACLFPDILHASATKAGASMVTCNCNQVDYIEIVV